MKKLNWIKQRPLVQQLAYAGLLLGSAGQAQAAYELVGTYDKTECVKDTTTNLIWEGKTADGSSRDGSKKYTNYDATYGTSTQINAATNSIGYMNTVNASPLCGFTGGWRMPTKEELETLVKTGSSPTIDTTWFPNTPASVVWSGSPYASLTGGAWVVYFSHGYSSGNYRSYNYGVRLVRGGQSSASLTAQTISFTVPASLTVGGVTGTASGTATSNLAVTYSTTTTSICTVDSSTGVVTPVAAGTCTIEANQAGNATYSAATKVTKDITVSAAATASPRYVQVDNYPLTECVKDTTTNLIWEGKTADGSSRDGSKKYTNYDATYGTSAQINAATNSIGYMNTVNASPLCGFTGGWRMPTKEELETLVKIGSSPTIDTTWFPNTPASDVWSGSPNASSASRAWGVGFYYGYSYGNYGRNYGYGVRLVRGGQSSASLTAQTISFTVPASLTVGGVTGTASGTATSNLAVTYSTTTTSICTVDSSTGVVTPVAAGTCTIEANQAGNATYSAATKVTKDIVINAAAAASQYVQVDSYLLTECVKDTTTNLIWEGKTADGSSRDGSKKYTNYDATYGTSTQINAATNSIGYMNTVNASPLCGFTGGWRMPTKEELETLVKIGSSPTIDTTWFPNTPASNVWSGSPYADGSSFAWGVYFGNGYSGYSNRDYDNGVRLVRGGQSLATLTAQTISFGTAPSLQAGGATGTVTATGGASGNAVTFTSTTTSICTVDSSTGVVTPVAAGTCTIEANQAGNATYSAATKVTKDITVGAAQVPTPPTPTPAPATAPTPPVTPIALKDGVIGNTVQGSGEVLKVCNTMLHAGNTGASVHATGVNGVIDVTVQTGSIDIPCPVANPFCKAAQNQVTALMDETVRFGANCEVSRMEITPPNPSTIPVRLNGKPLIDSVIEVLQAKVPGVGTETLRKANDWSALGLGFSIGNVSVKAQLPMQVNPVLPDSASLLPNGVVQVVTQGIIVNLVPALIDVSRFNKELQTLGSGFEMRTNADGNIVINHNRSIYSVRPNLFLMNTDSSLFTVNENEEIRFDNQRIHPAAYNFEQFRTMLTVLDSSATVQVQLDGKIYLTMQGQSYTLTPDYEVLPNTQPSSPSGFAVKDGKLVVNYPFGFSQQFSVKK